MLGGAALPSSDYVFAGHHALAVRVRPALLRLPCSWEVGVTLLSQRCAGQKDRDGHSIARMQGAPQPRGMYPQFLPDRLDVEHSEFVAVSRRSTRIFF